MAVIGPRWDDVYQAYRTDIYYRRFGAQWREGFWIREWATACTMAVRGLYATNLRAEAMAIAARLGDGVLYRTMMGQSLPVSC